MQCRVIQPKTRSTFLSQAVTPAILLIIIDLLSVLSLTQPFEMHELFKSRNGLNNIVVQSQLAQVTYSPKIIDTLQVCRDGEETDSKHVCYSRTMIMVTDVNTVTNCI